MLTGSLLTEPCTFLLCVGFRGRFFWGWGLGYSGSRLPVLPRWSPGRVTTLFFSLRISERRELYSNMRFSCSRGEKRKRQRRRKNEKEIGRERDKESKGHREREMEGEKAKQRGSVRERRGR